MGDVNFTTIRGCDITSGDDNIAIKRGSSFIHASDNILRYGKGVSIGSLGERESEGSVTDSTFDNFKVFGAQHGARIKTWRGGRGKVSNLTFSRFVCEDCGVATLVDQDYCPRSQKPNGCQNETSSIEIANVHFDDFSGRVRGESHDFRCHGGGRKGCDVVMKRMSLRRM